SNVIITDLTRENGEKITVAIKAERKGNALEVNDIASIHGKSAERTLSDFTKAVGENATRPLNEILKYVNKEKALNWLTNSAPMAQSSNQGVNSVANIINSHENPKIDEDFLRMFSVYHGSPYSFDKFSSSQIGTGEGAQGYGYGLYFTDLEDVAKDYAKKLADRKLGLLNPNFEQSTWDNAPLTEVLKNNYDKFFIQSLHNSRNTAEYRNTVNTAFRDVRLKKPNGFEQQRKWIIDAIDSGKIKVAEVEPEGNLYKVKIHGDKTIEELNFIRWDKPLKARERQRLSELLYNEVVKTPEHQGNEDNVKRIINEEFDGKFNFGEIYGFITSWLGGSNVNASNFLLRSGIDGIQYPTYYQNDPSDKDTYNYVVFDENAIEIQEHIRLMATPNGEVYGFVTPEGDIYLDPENLNANTPIHEFGHLWNDYAKKNNPKLYNKGVELIKNSTYWQKVNDNPAYAHLSDEQKADEALAMAIGDKGEQIYQDQKTGFVAWLRDLWNWIRGNNPNPEIRNLNSDQIQNLTLEQFVSGAATDLLSGEQMATSPQSQSSQNITRTQSNVEYANQSDYDFDVSGITKENAQEMQRIKTVAQANGTFMLAPNGQPTNLNEREWLQVRTKNFIKWFGDWINKPINASKIVDENGEPMRVYHGTDEAFTEFDFSNWRRSSDASGKGFYFTPNEKTARGFGRHMMPVFLNIKNPFVGWSSLDADTRKNLEKKEGVWEDALRETGFDGDLTKNDIFAAFNPAQIKSATSNNGNFDEQQDDIRFNVLPNQQSPQANQSPLTESDRTQNSDIRFQATRSNNNSISKLEAQRVLSATKTGGIAAGYTALQETDWYKNLSRAEKNRITQNNFMNAVIQNMQQQTLITERIKPEVRTNTQPPKKINQIIADAAKNLGSTLIYGKAMRRNAAGSYNPSLALVRIKNAGDIDTVAHELGHFIDDKFDFLGNINPANTANIEIELKWFSDRGGSKPSANLSKEKKQEYLKREGLAEFIRAYIVNPQAAQQKAPNLYQELEQILDDKAKKALKDFSDDFISFANATSGGMITANVNDSTLKNKTEFLNFRKKTDGFGFSLWDNINSAIFDSAAKANKAFAYINKLAGDKKLLPEKDFRLLYRVFAGINGKIDTILRSGLTDGRNNRLFTSGIEKEINEANTQWNKQLDDFKAGKLHSSATLNLGKPQETLKAAGINEIEITLKQSILSEKLEQHGLTTDELKNLADAIQNPILVYEWGTKAKSNVIITDLTRENGEKITVAIKAE
ncbi:MAG: hypothetical protein LBE36_05355, partial [Flavobacteriaceae bacterium]|nr:hypothetical protein [Flavobacteriaceae bacterium]